MMKTNILLLAVLTMSPLLAHAQQANNSGVIDRSDAVEQLQDEQHTEEDRTVKHLAKTQARKIEISRNPDDMYDTTGMDAYEVITWTDSNGVRHFTDDARKAPKMSNKKNIYSLPPANNAHEHITEEQSALDVEDEDEDQ